MTAKLKGKMNSIDRHVAARIRGRREELNLSQADLAGPLGVTYQQVQKTETGINRISAGNLWKAAKKLNVPVGYFYEGL